MKIGLIGCAGCGKGYTATQLSKELKLPYLSSKDITRPILKKYNYVYDENNFVEKFLSQKSIEYEIVDQRIYEESLLEGGFITDRTTLECFCYAFLNLCSYSQEEFMMLEKICREDLKQFDKLFYFPLEGSWLEKNEVRTTNTNLQWKIDMLIRGLIEDWKLDIEKIPVEYMKQQKMKEYILQILK